MKHDLPIQAALYFLHALLFEQRRKLISSCKLTVISNTMAGEPSFQNMGTSIPVANVQALAASIADSSSIPPRYIRPEAKTDLVARADEGELPVIDFGRLLDPGFSQQESAKLHDACVEWGFFHLINHQVPEEVVEKMKADIADFFKLPLEERKKVAQLPNNIEGYGQAFVVSDEQKLDWADIIFLLTRPLHLRNMRFWPSQPLSFRDTLSCYSTEMKRVAGTLMEHMAKKLGVEPEELLGNFKDYPQTVRINYYPPCPKADEVLGLSPHTDSIVALTLLLQINDVQGLQIKHQEKWFPVQFLPGAFIVNLGDILEIMSNGKYKSAEHRSMVNSMEERLSIATFLLPSEDSEVGPLPGLTKGRKDNYKKMSYREFMKAFFSSKLAGKSMVESIKL